ncbi:MAG: M23 family metallopeptidase, partial [Thermomicrobiaceae bacterium]|nr:M23 family metallopeptidase [Thermomicrobiaceae bacterium]
MRSIYDRWLGSAHPALRRAIVTAVALASLIAVVQPTLGAGTPTANPNSVVPAAFSANMGWSEERGWHWVKIQHDGKHRLTTQTYDVSIGTPVARAYIVATRVRSLRPDDPCNDCLMVSDTEQGPPSILGGPENPALAEAYKHLDNGPRRRIQKDDGKGERWTNGAWYLNYSPLTQTFFSWTWIPEDWTASAKAKGLVPDTSVLPTIPSAVESSQVPALAAAPAGSRVFPLPGNFRMTQGFGCVPANAGYASPAFCPPSKPSFHDGVDLAAPAGTVIRAAASGTVTFAGLDGGPSGNSKIVIVHDGPNAGFETIYLHWQQTLVRAGQHVQAGQPIAKVGSVGYSTGPHLHFTVKQIKTGAAIDPLRWLQSAARA